jgi:hypothetical protein
MSPFNKNNPKFGQQRIQKRTIIQPFKNPVSFCNDRLKRSCINLAIALLRIVNAHMRSSFPLLPRIIAWLLDDSPEFPCKENET